MSKSLIIWGASGHAKVLREITCAPEYTLVAVFDNNENIINPFNDTPLYIGEQGFSRWRSENNRSSVVALVAIGGSRGKDRLEIQGLLAASGFPSLTSIHPRAYVAGSAKLGVGCQILANAAVGVDALLGDTCIVNTSASVDHECVLGHGVHIAPGAHLAGLIEIGDFSFVGVGASILPRIKIGRNCIIGAGAVVTKNLPDNVVAYGNPARIVKSC